MYNVLQFPGVKVKLLKRYNTPLFNKIETMFQKLQEQSNYNCEYDLSILKRLEQRFLEKEKYYKLLKRSWNITPLRMVNDKLVLDSYVFGCTSDAILDKVRYHYKLQGCWNKPFPLPINIISLWKQLWTIFETNSHSLETKKIKEYLLSGKPIYLGNISDPLMWIDRKYKITQEVLRMFKHYNIKYIITTRSDLVACSDDHLNLIDKNLAQINIKFTSLNDSINKLIEPGAPSARRRLKYAPRLVERGIKVTAQIETLPKYKDGYFTSNEFDRENMPNSLEFFNFKDVETLYKFGIRDITYCIMTLNDTMIKEIYYHMGRDLRSFYNVKRGNFRLYKYSNEEKQAYYDRMETACSQYGVNLEIIEDKYE